MKKCLPLVLVIVGCEDFPRTSKIVQAEEPPNTNSEEDRTSTISNSRACPGDMNTISGSYCKNVQETCLEWLPSPTKMQIRCARFAPSKCLSERYPMRYCIDVYEWPNRKGALPTIDVTWYKAKASCESTGKRLCTPEEWTLACEGNSVRPYPYGDGLIRDSTACVIDKPSMNPNLPRSEWPKFYSAEPSGSRERCVSSFGVYDTTGNVDEWVDTTANRKLGETPYVSGLKGGYWSTVRNRCRPMTAAHGPTFSFYQIGFRCCSDARSFP